MRLLQCYSEDSDKNKFAISIKWVTHEYLAMVAVGQTDDATLKNAPVCNGLHISKCFGYVCDRAANMSGHLNGVVARIQKEPKAHYFHCVAHSPDLCLQDCGQNCMTIHKALTVTIELALIIHASPKCLAQFWHLNV